MTRVTPPKTIEELMQRVTQLAGKTVGSCVKALEFSQFHKGALGQIAEQMLGASAGSRPAPDFVELGIELKTLPINHTGRVAESTYVCALNLAQKQQDWSNSLVKRKLDRVLWLPVESDPALSLQQRRFGCGFIWHPSLHEHQVLQADWQEIIDTIRLQGVTCVNSRLGQYLQLRPKAAHGKSLTSARHRHLSPTLPRGFYLRASFTTKIFSSLGSQV